MIKKIQIKIQNDTINGYVYVEKISQYKNLSMAYNIGQQILSHVVMKRKGA